MPKILVTGALGYIGVRLVSHLLQAPDGYEVIGIDNDLYHDATHGPLTAVPDQRLTLYRRDIRDLSLSDLDGVEIVMHLAALSNDPLGNLDERLTDEINCLASVRLAELAAKAGVERFLFSSSCSTYGAAGDALLAEDATLNPVTAYGHSKVEAEAGILALASDTFSPTALRNATAFGYSSRWRQDIVLNDFAASAWLNKQVKILSDGTPWRPLVHIGDICRAFTTIATADRSQIHAESFNVGSNSANYRVSELAEIVAGEIPDCSIDYAPGGGPDKRCYRVDCSKIVEHVPAFACEFGVQDGVSEMLEAFAKYGLASEDIAAGKYARLPAIARRQAAGEVDDLLRRTCLSGTDGRLQSNSSQFEEPAE
ncbi:MAG TPA: NAD-dependent dehydratase [Planctomycetaceae bacterium]|nr:NAD-dependent dehydratase [Planctomycetaceae bacterium]